MANILIGGDFVPTQSNYKYFIKNDLENLFGKDLFNLLINANYKIFNLEAPITNCNKKISKEGPNLKINPEIIKGIKKLKINLFSLSNNHILDYGEQGLIDTIKYLNQCNISYVGAGNNLKDASKIFTFEINKLKIGVYSCTEHEYTLATNNTSGANPFDALYSLDHIFEAKQKVDYLIVIYHGGKEYYKYPTPYLQKVCRRIAEKGADLILCQHSHCIGTYENYMNSKILYGQGNFLFDRNDSRHFLEKQTGLLVSLEIDDVNNKIIPSLIPIKKQKEKIFLADENEKAQILKQLKEDSEKIINDSFIKNNYNKISKIDGGRYLVRLSKIGTLLVAVDNKFFKSKIFNHYFIPFNSKQRHTLENMLQCEVHNELVLNYLKNVNNKGNNK